MGPILSKHTAAGTDQEVTKAVCLLIADDHLMIRIGLKKILETRLGIHQIKEASSCEETISALRRYKPTHLIIDMVFGDGTALEILPSIISLFPKLHILVYSMMPQTVYHSTLQHYGVRGFLGKESSVDKTVSALQSFFSPAGFVSFQEAPPATGNPFARLSPRELEVLHYLLKGESISFAARHLIFTKIRSRR